MIHTNLKLNVTQLDTNEAHFLSSKGLTVLSGIYALHSLREAPQFEVAKKTTFTEHP